MGTTTAAGLLAVVGVFDLVGTLCSGYLTDRVNPRLLLAVYYALRGVGLVMLPLLLTDSVPTIACMKRRAFVLLNRTANAVVRRVRPRRFRGADLLLLTTTGRKSGKARTTPLVYLPDGDRWIVVASNGGADWEPGWWLNVRAGSPATVELDGTSTAVVGTEVTGPEREQLWHRLNDEVTDYTAYQAKVSRRLAVVALTAISTQ